MALKLYPIRLEEWQIIELEQRAGSNPVAPLIRKIISDWLGQDNNPQKEQILNEIEGLNGQINLLNQQIVKIDELEHDQQMKFDTESGRVMYLKSNPKVFEMYKDKTISPDGYRILISKLGFKNKDEVEVWLGEVAHRQAPQAKHPR